MKHALIAAFTFIGTVLYAQNQNSSGGQGNSQWTTNGNVVDTNQFIGSKNAHPVVFKSTDTERFRLTPEGKLGIGTTLPQTLLDVNGNATFRDKVYFQNLDSAQSTSQVLFIDPNSGELQMGEIQTMSYPIPTGSCMMNNGINPTPTWSNDTNRIFSYCPQVYVGIGTDLPNYTLDVRGTGYFQGGLRFGIDHTLNNAAAYIEGYLPNVMSNSPIMRVMQEDNGVDRTLFLIERSGGLYCTSARVRLKEDIPVPDFVFQPDYKLMPLPELKQFVETHSHLPEIPSEKVIREEGLSLDEMQLKLLQKVEELTLYVIELDEQNQLLKEQLENLKK